jgi:hypothetical protein
LSSRTGQSPLRLVIRFHLITNRKPRQMIVLGLGTSVTREYEFPPPIGMNCLALGRLGNDFEELRRDTQKRRDEDEVGQGRHKVQGGRWRIIRSREPHLLLELSLERKSRKVNGQEREGEGRMVHRADVLKDRTWALNGKTFRWSDKSKYDPGAYRQVWESIRPHFEEVQATMQRVTIRAGSSQSLISDSGDSEFYHQRQLPILRSFWLG